jgi:hypothetical protein
MFPETKWFIGREELKRLRDSTFVTWHKVCRAYSIPPDAWSYNGQDHYIQFANGSRVDLLDLKRLPSDPLYERYGSTEFTGGWIEEAGEVDFDAFDTLKSRIGRQLNDRYGVTKKLLLTMNPKRNWAYRLFYKPFTRGELPENATFIRSLVGDNPFIETGYQRNLEEIENDAKRERLLYGNWDYEDEPDQLIQYQWIEACENVEAVAGPKYMGVDVARYGDDETTWTITRGNEYVRTDGDMHLSIDQVTDRTKQIMRDEYIRADCTGVDGIGVGAGVVDNLRRDGSPVEDIQVGSKAPYFEQYKEYQFKNLRSFVWWHAREEIRSGAVRLVDLPEKLVEDLTAPRYDIVQDRMIAVESKDDIKKRIGRSTDWGDSYVQARYMALLRQTSPPGERKLIRKDDYGLF